MSVINGGLNHTKSGLVFYFDSANPNSYTGTASTWSDIASVNFTGNLTNNPTFTTDNKGSFIFDGVNDHVSTNYTTALGTSSLTVGVWLSYTASQIGGIFSKRRGASSFEQLSIFIAGDVNANSAGTRIVINDFNNPASRNAITTASYNDGLWHYLTLVRGTSDNKFYVDARLVDTTTAATPNLVTTTRLFFSVVGQEQSPLGFYFRGRLAVVQLYNRTLSAAEILQNYNSMKGRFGR